MKFVFVLITLFFIGCGSSSSSDGDKDTTSIDPTKPVKTKEIKNSPPPVPKV